jgi:hypothetical protein
MLRQVKFILLDARSFKPASSRYTFPSWTSTPLPQGLTGRISYVLNNWPPSSNYLSDSPSVYRPAQCSAALAGRIAVLEDLLTYGCPIFNEDDDMTVPKAAAEGAAKREDTTVLEFLLEKGWDLQGGL